MKTTVVSVQPIIDQKTGQQRTWTSKEGKTSFYFMYHLADGRNGEVGHQNPQPRFPVGTEVEATDSTNPQYPQYPKLKLEKPGGGFGGQRTQDPEYQARVKAAGMVQAAISGGAKNDQEIDALVTLGFGAAERWKQRIMASTPAPVAQQPAAPVYQPPVQPQYQPPTQPQYAPPQGYQQPAPQPPYAVNPGAPFPGQPQQQVADGNGPPLPF